MSQFPEADQVLAPSFGKAKDSPPAPASIFPDADKVLAPSLAAHAMTQDPASDWDGLRQTLDAAVFGKYSASDPKLKAAKESWEKENKGKAITGDIVGRSVPMLAIGAAASLVLPELGAVAGLAGLGRFLAGTFGEGTLARLASMATQGAWQGGAGAEINNLVGAQPKESVGGGTLAGGLIGGPAGAILNAPFRSTIEPGMAALAKAYQTALGSGNRLLPGRLTLAQVPGAAPAARGLAALMRLGKSDIPRLTKSLMRSIGADESTPLTTSNISKELTNIGQRASDAAAKGDQAGVKLAYSQAMNAKALHDVATASGDTGLADPDALATVIRNGNVGKNSIYPQGQSISDVSNALGNPTNIADLAAGAPYFARENPGPLLTLQNFKNFGMGAAGTALLGEGAVPLAREAMEYVPHGVVEGAKVAGGAALAGYGAGGALMNNPLYLNLLLRGAMPSVNQFVSPAQQIFGDSNIGSTPAGAATLSNSEGLPDRALAFMPKVGAVADKYGLDPKLLAAQINQESGFKNLAPNKAGAAGIAQFIPETAKKYGVDVTDVDSSLDGMGRYMRDLRMQFNGNTGLALAAYNMGENGLTAALAGKRGIPDETRNYVQSVTGRSLDDWIKNGPHGVGISPGPTSVGFSSVLQPITGPGPTQDQISNVLAGSQ